MIAEAFEQPGQLREPRGQVLETTLWLSVMHNKENEAERQVLCLHIL
jgi:hypothetical protein